MHQPWGSVLIWLGLKANGFVSWLVVFACLIGTSVFAAIVPEQSAVARGVSVRKFLAEPGYVSAPKNVFIGHTAPQIDVGFTKIHPPQYVIGDSYLGCSCFKLGSKYTRRFLEICVWERALSRNLIREIVAPWQSRPFRGVSADEHVNVKRCRVSTILVMRRNQPSFLSRLAIPSPAQCIKGIGEEYKCPLNRDQRIAVDLVRFPHFSQLSTHGRPLEYAYYDRAQRESSNGESESDHPAFGTYNAVFNFLYIGLHVLARCTLCFLAVWTSWRWTEHLTGWMFLIGLLLYVLAGIVIWHALSVTQTLLDMAVLL